MKTTKTTKKIKNLITLLLTISLLGCNTDETEVQTANFIPERFTGNWKKSPTRNTKAEIRVDRLTIIQENITRANITEVIQDNGSTLFKANLGNGETLTLLLATYNTDTPNDDVLGITITNSNTPNVYVTNGSYTRE